MAAIASVLIGDTFLSVLVVKYARDRVLCRLFTPVLCSACACFFVRLLMRVRLPIANETKVL